MQFVPKKILPISLLAFLTSIFLLQSVTVAHHDDKSLRNKTIKNIKNDDTRGEDLRIRQVAVEALGNRAGTIVVMSPQSGRIYTIVNQNWGIRKGFKPCSTIKLVTGIAGYSENLIRSNGNLAKGSYRLGLNDSLAYSNNSYFQKVGGNLGNKKMIAYAKRLGLGERTGINAPGEFVGKLPYGNSNPRIYSHADGFQVTPLQLAVMVSAISNGGDLVIPQVLKSRYSQANFRGYYKRELNLAPTVFERVIPGMIGAVKYGTARRINDPHLNIAGKTGSCIADGTWVGLFASVAPIRDPKFAVIVITKGKYARGKHSAAIAGKIYKTLRGRFRESYNGTLARKNIRRYPRTQVASNATKSRKIAANTPSKRNPKTIRVGSSPRRSTNTSIGKPRVVKASHKKPKSKEKNKFGTIVIGGKTEITRPRIVKN